MTLKSKRMKEWGKEGKEERGGCDLFFQVPITLQLHVRHAHQASTNRFPCHSGGGKEKEKKKKGRRKKSS